MKTRVSLLATIAVAGAAHAQSACETSYQALQVRFGDSPRQVGFADLNDDGLADAVATQGLNDRVAVCLALGGGAFAEPVYYDTGDNPHTLCLADLNGDGFRDIVAATRGDGTLTPLLNDQSGAFTPGTELVTGLDYFHVTSADVNADGFEDIAAIDANGWSLIVYFSDGAGALTWAGQANYTYLPYGSAMGDIDGDTLPDLAVAIPNDVDPLTGGGSVYTYFNLGNDGMGVWQGFSFLPAITGTSPFPKRIRIADVDGVAGPELIVACDQFSTDTGRIDVLSDQVGGVFQSRDFYTIGTAAPDVAVGDFDGDGAADISAVSAVNEDIVSVLMNNGDGTFASPLHHDLPGNFLLQAIELADCDGDGDLDQLVGGISGQAGSVLINDGAGSFGVPQAVPSGDFPNTIVLVDVNKDGHDDVLTSSGGGAGLAVHLGNGDGTIQAQTQYPGGNTWGTIPSADFDGDAWIDLAMADGTAVRPLLNDQAGGFLPGTLSPAIPDAQSLAGIAAADLDGDTHADLAVTFNASAFPWRRLQILFGDGQGGFTLGPSRALGSNAGVIHAHNVDGDADVDLIVLRPYVSDGITVLYNDGAGAFASATDFPTVVPAQNSQGSICMVTADIDGDNDIDVAISNVWTDSVTILENNGAGSYTTHPAFPTGPGPFGIDAADIDGDGDMDLLTGVNQGNTIDEQSMYGASVHVNGGGFVFTPGPQVVGSYSPYDVAFGDLDGDDVADLLICAASADAIDVHIGSCAAAPAEPCLGDANGDSMVNFADVTAVLNNWNADYTPGTGPGDANADGVVNFTDVTSILSNWNTVCP